MKKGMLACLLCLALLVPGAVLAEPGVPLEETLEIHFLGAINANYVSDQYDIFKQIEAACNVKFNIEWAPSDGYAERISTTLASGKLPDIFTPGIQVTTLVDEGAIVVLDPYLDLIPNYMRFISPEQMSYIRSARDGQIYAINHITEYKPAYAMVLRTDWLKRLGLETPNTIDEWLTVWRAFRDGDANGNGDPNDEIPFVDPATFTSGKPAASLLLLYGIQSNGLFYYDDEGAYSLVYEHEKYRDYLELMRLMYAEGLLDSEVFTHTATDVAQLFNTDTAGSGYQWISRPQNTTKTLRDAGVADALLSPVLPIQGPDGTRLIPQRNPFGTSFVLGYQTETNGTIEDIMAVINYLYSDEGIFLANYGEEGVHHTLQDGKPVLREDIRTDPSFRTARNAGLICQLFPGVWTKDNYDQIVTTGKSYNAMEIWDQQMYDGTLMYWDYYFDMPPTLATDAYGQYSADILTKIDELRAGCITGTITVDAFFEGYEALRAHGLEEILEQAQEAWSLVIKP